MADGVRVFGVRHLAEVVRLLENPEWFSPQSRDRKSSTQQPGTAVDFRDVRGQTTAKRALEVAAAGEHNVLLVGPPGSEKTMLAKRFAGILPPLPFAEALKTTQIYSVAGLLPKDVGLMADAP